MITFEDELNHALDVLALPKLVTKKDIRAQYHSLSKKHHPDFGGDVAYMEQINSAYTLLMQYIDAFRYSFSEDEIFRQFPGAGHAKKFQP